MLTKQPHQRLFKHDTRLGDDPRAQRADTAAKRWPLTFFAVQQGGKCDRQGPVAVNPRPAGSPVFAPADLTAGSRYAVRHRRHLPALPSSPQALHAGLAGPKIRLLLSAGLFGVDTATPPVPPHPAPTGATKHLLRKENNHD